MNTVLAGRAMCLAFAVIQILIYVILPVSCERLGIRGKRGAAYAGGHPGGGYDQGGVGIPGLNNVIQYSAYNTLLNNGNHGQSSGYGGGSSHGRKLTVDQAIGMFGHHTLNTPYPYTAGHNAGGGGHQGGGGGGSYGGGNGGTGSYGR